VAEFLVRRVEQAERRLAELTRRLTAGALERLGADSEALGRSEERLLRAAGVLSAERTRLAEAARLLAAVAGKGLARGGDRLRRNAAALTAAAPRTLQRRRRARLALAERLVRAARAELRGVGERCAGLERVAAQLAPERVLARGFSITRGAAGALLRRADQVVAGERLLTRLAEGTVASRAEAPLVPIAGGPAETPAS
jgi:exodeoxyribonuclease VII large subunit